MIFKRNKVIKNELLLCGSQMLSLGVLGRFLLSGCMKLGSQVKEYLEEKQVPSNCPLVMDNATAI